jgi:hypothetical protein
VGRTGNLSLFVQETRIGRGHGYGYGGGHAAQTGRSFGLSLDLSPGVSGACRPNSWDRTSRRGGSAPRPSDRCSPTGRPPIDGY